MEATSENPYCEFDRYDLRHYLAHLERAGRSGEVHEVLLRESREFGRPRKKRSFRRLGKDDRLPVTRFANAWYAAHEDVGETESYLSDVARCWRLAEEVPGDKLTDRGLISSVALEARYALISSCVNNLAGNIPPPLLARAIKHSLITTSQGLAYARQTPDLQQKALSLASVGAQLEPSSCSAVLFESLGIAQTIPDQTKRAATLVAMADWLGAAQLQRAIEIASEILFPNDRLQALLGLVPHLTEAVKNRVLEQGLAIVEEFNDDHDKAEALIAIAVDLPISRKVLTFERAFKLLEETEANYQQGNAIEKFIRVAPNSMLERARALAMKIEMEESRITALSPLAARVASQGDVEAALRLIRNISPEKYSLQRAVALRESARYLPPDAIRSAIKMSAEILAEQHRANALAALAPYLPENLLNSLFSRAKAMKEARPRAVVLTALVPRLAGRKRDEALKLVVDALRENLSYEQADVLADLAPHLSGPLLKLLFDTARKINDRAQQIQAIAGLVRRLEGDAKPTIVRELIEQASDLEDTPERAETYISLLPVLLELGDAKRALEIARSLKPWSYFARALAKVTTCLDPAVKEQELQSLIGLLERSRDQFQFAEVIPVIAGQLSEELISRAVGLSLNVEWEGGRVTALAGLAPYVPEEILLTDYLSEIGRVVSDFSSRKLRVAFATRLASLGKGREALTVALDDEDELYVVNALEGIIPYLDEGLLSEVFRVSESFSYDGRKHSVFAMLAPRFAELGNEQAARYLIAENKAPLQAALAAARVTRSAIGDFRTDSIRHALVITKNMQGAFGAGQGWWQAEVLNCIAPYLSGDFIAEAWRLAVRIDEENDRYKALSSLAIAHATQVQHMVLYPIWSDSLHHLATRSRRHLLSDLRALSPIIFALGDANGIADVVSAISDVGRWW